MLPSIRGRGARRAWLEESLPTGTRPTSRFFENRIASQGHRGFRVLPEISDFGAFSGAQLRRKGAPALTCGGCKCSQESRRTRYGMQAPCIVDGSLKHRATSARNVPKCPTFQTIRLPSFTKTRAQRGVMQYAQRENSRSRRSSRSDSGRRKSVPTSVSLLQYRDSRAKDSNYASRRRTHGH